MHNTRQEANNAVVDEIVKVVSKTEKPGATLYLGFMQRIAVACIEVHAPLYSTIPGEFLNYPIIWVQKKDYIALAA